MRYCFRIETPQKTHSFSVALGTQISNWIRILRRARKTCDETGRTHDVKLRKNVDKLIFLHRSKNPAEVIKYCEDEFVLFTIALRYDKTKPTIFIKTMTNAQLNSFDVGHLSQDP